MKTWRFFRCPRCGHVEETLVAASYVEHSCPALRHNQVVCRGFDPDTEPKETKP